MAGQHLLQTRTGIWRYRRAVPASLREIIGKREIIHSFDTKDAAKAEAAAILFNREVERRFEEARRKLASGSYEFDAANAWVERRGFKPKPVDRQSRIDRDDATALFDTALAEHGFGDVEEFSEAIEADPERIDLRILNEKLGILSGDVERPLTLTRAKEEYVAEKRRHQPSERLRKQFSNQTDLVVSAAIKVVGEDKLVTEITRADARAILKHYEASGISPGSTKKYLNRLKALVGFAQTEHGLNPVNPFTGLKPADPEADRDKREAFSHEAALNAYAKADTMREELAVLLRLTILTGARIGEIVGLQQEDVVLDAKTPEGKTVPHILIRPNDIRGLKTKASKRAVPLTELGVELLKVWAAKVKRGEPVFPSYAHDGGADAASTYLNRWLLEQKLRGEKQTLHSFRHAMKDWLREARTPKELADMIQGHTAKDAAGNYGSSELLELKLEALEKATAFLSGADRG